MQKSDDWQLSAVSGHKEPPKLHWLLGRLAGLAAPVIEHEQICKHAYLLHFAAERLSVGLERRGHKIGVLEKGNYFASPVKSPGRAAALQRLEKAARSNLLKRWLGAWAAVSQGERDLVIQALPSRLRPERAIHSSWVSFSAPGLIINAPAAIDALPAIREARKGLNAVDAQERKKRRPDPELERFVEALKKAFRQISGQKPTVTWNEHANEWKGDFFTLVRDIDQVYGTKIARTKSAAWHLRNKRKSHQTALS